MHHGWDIRNLAEEHSHAYDIIHGRLAFEPAAAGQHSAFSNFRFSPSLDFETFIAEGEAAGWLPRADNTEIHTGAYAGEINHHKVMQEIEANWASQGRVITSYTPTNGYAGYTAAHFLDNFKWHHPLNNEVTISL